MTLQIGYGVAGSSIFAVTPTTITSNAVHEIPFAAIDLNRDGNLDIVASQSSTDFYCYIGDGAGAFSAVPGSFVNTLGYNVTGIAYADFNADGYEDAILGNSKKAGSVWLGYASAAFGDPTQPGFLTTPGPEVQTGMLSSIRTVDWNLDGILDFVGGVIPQCGFCAPGSKPAQILFGIGNGSTFVVSGQNGLLFTVPGIQIGDFNEDGAPDAVIGGPLDKKIEILRNQYPSPGFASTIFNTQDWVSGLSVVDINSDGHLDVVTAGMSNYVEIAPGNGAGAFATTQAILVSSAPNGIIAHDFDGNGRMDVARAGTSSVKLLSQSNPTITGMAMFGSGTPGCHGITTLTLSKPVSASAGKAEFYCTNVPANSIGLLLIDDAPLFAPVDLLNIGLLFHLDIFAGSYLIAGTIISDAGGDASLTMPATNLAPLIGTSHAAQAIWAAPNQIGCSGATDGLHASNGLSITIQP